MDSRSDQELLRATPRDPDAFAAFYRRHVRAVIALAARRAGPDDVGDIVAEVFATALVHRRRYDPGRGSAGAWLTGIALNKLADARRRGAVQARMCERLMLERPPLEGTQLDRPDDLVGVLPDDQRRAVSAHVLDDQSYRRIAAQERVSEQTVRKRVSRGLSALRDRLGEEKR
jgi:RNA polymerase sigma factor (sigma-70 family)